MATLLEIYPLEKRPGFRIPGPSSTPSDEYATLVKSSITYTAVEPGLVGNDITVAYVNPGTASASLSVDVDGTDITVNLATDAGTAATAVLSSDGTEPADGDTVTVNDVTYRFKNTMAAINDVKRSGVDSDTDLDNLVAAVNQSGTGGVEYFTGTVAPTGVTAGARTGTGATGAVTFTADDVGTAGNAFAKSESSAHLDFDGAGAVFTGGVNPAITSTGTQVKNAVNADDDAPDLVVASGTNASVVTAFAATNLSGGEFKEDALEDTEVYQTVKGNAVFQVDLDDGEVRKILMRNRYRYIELGLV